MHPSLRAVSAAVCFAGLVGSPLAVAQDTATSDQSVAQPGVQEGDVIPGSYLVRFAQRSFDLEQYRQAVYSRRSAAEIEAIVADLDARVQRDQAEFVAAIEAMGGRVTAQWWIINGAAVDGLGAGAEAMLATLPGVVHVEADQWHVPHNNTARNSAHHEADQANQLRDGQNQLIRGTGLSVAVIDTGLDMQFASTGRPHPAFYPGGTQVNQTGGGMQGSRVRAALGTSGTGSEDFNSHGTHVAGSVASDFASYRGIAPGAWIVGIKISGSGSSGSASSTSLVGAWQAVASNRGTHNVAVANNSFSGSPSLTSSIQVALDNTAFNADVLIACSAGNSGGNTSGSQNVWNGLAVGSINKNTRSVSSFSGRGTLDGFGRTYPDITAVGASVDSCRLDSTSSSRKSGTSMASPMVAGGAALVRQAVPTATALETKAILLASTKLNQTSRNSYGLGVMDCDEAVKTALAGDFHTVQVSGTGVVHRRDFTVPTNQTLSLVATWMHRGGGSFDNVNMRILRGTTQVAADNNALNSYESVDFLASAGVTYTLELSRTSSVLSVLDVAIGGLPDRPVTQPALTAIQPGQVQNSGAATVTLTGTLDRIDSIDVGPTQITTFTMPAADQIEFRLPSPTNIGTFPVTVTNAVGTSNALSLTVTGTHPAQLSAPPIGVRGVATNVRLIGDAGWNTLLFVSNSTAPSALPGIVNLNIGLNFTLLFQMGQGVNDARGLLDTSFVMPTGVPSGAYSFQAITWDPAAITLPLEVSNRSTISYF